MENIEDNQDVDALARQQAALAAQARARGVAEGIAQAHAEDAFNAARQNAAGYAERFPDGRPRRWDIPPPPPPPGGIVQGVPVAPPPPGFAVGAMNALTDVSKAMSALVENLSRHPERNSRGRDGDVVIHKDISRVFEKVPEDILERVQYVKTVENRLQTNTSGVLLKIDSEIISSIRVADDATVASNFRMYEFQNVQVTVPFAVVFSDAGKSSQIMLRNSAGEDCYATVPTRIMNKLSAQVYSYLYDKIPRSMRMLHSDTD